MADPEYTLDDAINELQRSWSQQQCIRVEELLKQHPDLKQDDHAVLDLIYAEVLLCEEKGLAPEEAEYARRFPELQEPIARQFQLHRALVDSPEQVDLPTATADMTLPEGSTDHASPMGEFPQIAGFEILELAGRGGSGVAYRAYDKQLKRTVAIKLLHTMASQDTVQRQRLIREAEAAASLVHPGIVRIHQIGENKGAPYLVMEFIDGRSLSEALQEGPLAVDKAIDIVVQVARAIEHAHKAGVIHRDLKPANVLLDNDDQPYVCDFGLARQIESEFTLHATGDVMGTPAYMPPEQACGEGVTAASDVYSLGAVLYQCLTGRPPFLASTPWEIMTQVITDDPPTIRQLNSALPRDLETICSVALHKAANRRYASASALADELERFRNGKPIQARPTGRLEKTWKLLKRHPTVTSLVMVSAVAISGLAIVSTVSGLRVSELLQESESARTAAEVQRDVAFKTIRNLVYEVPDALRRREASVEARVDVLTAAIAGLQTLLDANSERTDIRLAMIHARYRFAEMLGQQGRDEEAEQQILEAIELCESINSLEGTIEMAQGYSNLAIHYNRVVKNDLAIETANKSIEFAQQAAAEDPDHIRPPLIEAWSKAQSCTALQGQEKFDEAMMVGRQALEIDRSLYQRFPSDRRVITQLADMDLTMATLCLQLGQTPEAEECLSECIPLIEGEIAKAEEDPELARRSYTASHQLGQIQYQQMRYEDALQNYRTAMAGYQHLVDKEPNRPGYRLKLGSIQTSAIPCLLALNQCAEATVLAEESISEFRKGMELGGEEYRVQRWAIFVGLLTLADLQKRDGQLVESTESVRLALKELAPVVEEFQMQNTVKLVSYLGDVLAAATGEENDASAEDVLRFKRSYETYQAAQKGNFDNLIENEDQLELDIQETSHPVMASTLLSSLCLSQGLQHASLVESKADVDLNAATNKVVATVKRYCEFPDNDPKFYLGVPELRSIRQTKQFREAFGFD